MMDTNSCSSSESSEQASARLSDPNVAKSASRQPYQLTVKRGVLALLIMYASQILVGVGLSYGFRFIQDSSDGAGTIDGQMIGMTSVLIGGLVALLWVWTDVHRLGPSFLPQIGMQPSVIKTRQAVMLVLLLFSATHFLAWTYRSVVLPLVDHGGVIGGGSQMFAHIQETGSVIGMAGFLVLALLVGPVMEEVVFRGYLQSALARRMPKWGALSITSLVFMAGHGPTILWPMYFIYSVAWGWVFMHTRSLKTAIAIHMLSNLFYTVVAVMGWTILA
jgi:membrane protease YdiL (CAAX protease family)